MANIKTFNDILPGSIVTSSGGTDYVVLCDDAGNRGLFSAKGTWIRPNDGELTFGKRRTAVSKIREFDTLPVLDRISEGIKYLYTDRRACAPLSTIYTSEDPRRIEALAEADRLEAAARRQREIADRYAR